MNRIHEAWFEFKGTRSTSMGIRLRQMPTRFLPGRNYTRETIAGRDGSVTTGDGAYKDVQVRIECDALRPEQFPEIWSWLSGSGLLRFSDEPNVAYEASVEKEFSRTPLHSRTDAQRFTVVWTCQPFRRAYPEPAPIEITESGTTLQNPGTAPSLPRVEIEGSGSFSLTIGKQTLFFRGVESGIIVDSELMDALSIDGALLANDKIDGEFFKIPPGQNVVQWLTGGEDDEGASLPGSISKITILPRWRFL